MWKWVWIFGFVDSFLSLFSSSFVSSHSSFFHSFLIWWYQSTLAKKNYRDHFVIGWLKIYTKSLHIWIRFWYSTHSVMDAGSYIQWMHVHRIIWKMATKNVLKGYHLPLEHINHFELVYSLTRAARLFFLWPMQVPFLTISKATLFLDSSSHFSYMHFQFFPQSNLHFFFQVFAMAPM